MSQQPPNSQPPFPEPESQNSVTSSKRVTQPAQTQANSSSVLKTQTIKLLRGTIRVLEGAVTKLETEPPPGSTQPSWWSAVLGKIRSLLPENLSSKLSDTALTGIVAGIAVILVWTTSSLLFGKPPEVATAPSPTPETPVATAPSPTPETPEIATAPSFEPENPPEVATAPSPEPESTPTIPTSVEEPVPTPTIPTPPELSAPVEPEPVEETPLPAPEPTSAPIVELTPEQTLIAAIEDRISQISNDANGLIQKIQVNFEGSSLTVKVGSDWYNLKPAEQDKLAAQMLEKSKELDFSRLEITDPQGTLLARSPVVGKDMIILNRVMGNG